MIIKKQAQQHVEIILLIILFMFYGSIFTLQKKIIENTEPFFTIGSRMVIAGILILTYIKFKYKKFNIKKNHYYYFFLLSFYNIYLTNILEIYGLSKLESSKVCLLYSLSPFLSFIVAAFSLKEKITKKKILGLFIGLIGILIGTKNTEQSFTSIIKKKEGELATILAVFFSVIGWIQLKKLLNLNYSPILSNGISMFFGGIFILIHSALKKENWISLDTTSNTMQYLLLTLITIIISNLICYNLFGFLLKKFSVTFMNFTGLITPIFAEILGKIFLNEKVTIFFFLSIPIIFLGLIIFYKEEIK